MTMWYPKAEPIFADGLALVGFRTLADWPLFSGPFPLSLREREG
jgi:hypothetical protein